MRELLKTVGSYFGTWDCRRRSRRAPLRDLATTVVVVWAIRRDWPDGAHEFIGPEHDQRAAAGLWQRDFGKWRRSPHRPRLSVVQISLRDFWLHANHRRDCRALDCPSAVDVVVA